MADTPINFETVLHAADFGLVGDGVTDDGAAMQTALKALLEAPAPAQLRFESDSSYYIEHVPESYVIDWEGVQDRGINGAGATFLLAGDVRFIHLRDCARIDVRNFNIDYHPLPFADGVVVAKNAEERWVDLRVLDEFDLPPLGGPTRTGGEQAYFGMVWLEGPHTLIGRHYWVADSREAYPESLADRIIRLEAEQFGHYDHIQVDETVVSLPVRGVAHRGGEEVFRIRHNEDIYFTDIDVWSAPWFVFGIHGNRGEVINRNVNIRPKPGTQRHTSSWRDGFHVKGNYANLLWEDCHFEGMNDDAFNISTHMSYVQEIVSPTEIEVVQNFPLGIVPLAPGDTLVAYDVPGGKLLGRRTLTAVDGTLETDRSSGSPRAPRITLHLDAPIPGLKEDDLVWNESSANPNTVLRRCTIKMSSRLQASVTLEDCDVSALLWFYGENIEGPIPSSVEVLNSRLRLGRGNPNLALSFTSGVHGRGAPSQRPTEPVLYNILLRDNVIDGHLNLEHAERVTVVGNHFETPRSEIHLANSNTVLFQDNTLGDTTLANLEQLNIGDKVDVESIQFRNRAPDSDLNLMKPFARWFARTDTGEQHRFHRLPEDWRPEFMASESGDAYRIPLAPQDAGYQGIYLDEVIPPGYQTLTFQTRLPEGTTQPLVAAVYHLQDDVLESLYEVSLQPDETETHNVSLPETIPAEGLQVYLYFASPETGSQSLYLSALHAVR